MRGDQFGVHALQLAQDQGGALLPVLLVRPEIDGEDARVRIRGKYRFHIIGHTVPLPQQEIQPAVHARSA